MRSDGIQHSFRRSGLPADARLPGAHGAAETVVPLPTTPGSLPGMAEAFNRLDEVLAEVGAAS
jgi:hypothetical protein